MIFNDSVCYIRCILFSKQMSRGLKVEGLYNHLESVLKTFNYLSTFNFKIRCYNDVISE